MSWRRRLVMLLGALLIGAFSGVTWVAWRGVQLYLHPPRHPLTADDFPSAYGVAFQALTLETADGVALAAWYVLPQNGCVILQAHGYGSHRDAAVTARFAQAGYGVLAWDFRAHGNSGGDISTLGGRELLDAEAALAYVLAQPEVRCVGAWGESMGGVVLLRLAARHPEVAAVVSDSAYPTLMDELRHAIHPAVLHGPMRLLGELATGVSFASVRPVDDIARLSPRPVLIIHGMADTITPADAAQRLYAAAGEPRTLWLVPDAEHVRARFVAPEAYDARVLGFLDAALRAP